MASATVGEAKDKALIFILDRLAEGRTAETRSLAEAYNLLTYPPASFTPLK